MILEPEVDDIASQENALFSRIALSANPRKTDYLGNRACGFSIKESCNLAGVTLGTLHKWRREDAEFAEFESNNLYELQKSIGPDILRLTFLRNFKLALKADFRILWRAGLLPIDELTSAEREQLKTIRKHYSPQDLLALHRALEPEAVEEDKGMFDRIVVIVNNEIVEGEAARRAGADALLNQWKENKKMLPEPEEKDNGDGDS